MTIYSPWHIDIPPWVLWKSSSSYTCTRTYSSGTLGLGYLLADAGGVASRHVEWDVALGAGTWQLTVIGWKRTNTGILTPSIGGSDLATWDTYNGSNIDDQVNQWSGIVVATDGIYELKLRTDTNNASSTDYDLYLQWLTFMRTA